MLKRESEYSGNETVLRGDESEPEEEAAGTEADEVWPPSRCVCGSLLPLSTVSVITYVRTGL
jgi:hypothetical protein